MKKASSRYLSLAIIIVLIVGWAMVSWYAWSDVGSSRLKGCPAVQKAVLPVLIMSWPAHEVCLDTSGVGSGANAHSAATGGTFVVFLIQAVLTWNPLLIAVITRKGFMSWLCGQLAVLLLLFATFWSFGNG
ncbi:MAG: hypothetical protein A2Z25_18495 [Planctomycetes bacterium RBG_16_55_9]|nr:MAG: hypothetical protein A2Z25_18495 [Planctomycetes bacterium RBG_16_55_9]